MDDDAVRTAVEDACARLEEEPLWHASLGSKELFHSNLLGWALENWRERGPDILGMTDRSPVRRVRRECLDLDLVVEFADDHVLVVENKAFALPDESQLRRYAEVVGRTFGPGATLMLLSLTDPGWAAGEFPTDHGTWRFVSYRRLGRRLHDAFAAAVDFPEQVVAHHALLLQRLSDLMDLVTEVRPHRPLALPDELRDRMKAVRIADAVGKARAQATMNVIRERVEIAVAGTAVSPERFEAGFSNGSPLLSVYFWAGPQRRIGWQFQNGQWRLAMMFGDLAGRTEESRAARIEAARAHAEYFDFGPMQDAVGSGGRDVSRFDHHSKLEFNRFDDDFVYRYRKVDSAVPVGTIVDLGVAYAQHAAAWSRRISLP